MSQYYSKSRSSVRNSVETTESGFPDQSGQDPNDTGPTFGADFGAPVMSSADFEGLIARSWKQAQLASTQGPASAWEPLPISNHLAGNRGAGAPASPQGPAADGFAQTGGESTRSILGGLIASEVSPQASPSGDAVSPLAPLTDVSAGGSPAADLPLGNGVDTGLGRPQDGTVDLRPAVRAAQSGPVVPALFDAIGTQRGDPSNLSSPESAAPIAGRALGFSPTGVDGTPGVSSRPAPGFDRVSFGSPVSFPHANGGDPSESSRDARTDMTADPVLASIAAAGAFGVGGTPAESWGAGEAASSDQHAGSMSSPMSAPAGGSSGAGASMEQSKTNELLQQLLDEVRRGRQPFLPLHDRDAEYMPL